MPEISVHDQNGCQRCGAPLPADLAPGPCGHCLKKPPFQQSTLSLFAYKGPVRDAILAWKLQGEDAGVRWLLATAAPRLRQLISPNDLLLPVPMPLSRMRKTGQHHATNLCRIIGEHTGCDWDWRLLRRIGEQPRQSSLSGAARRNNLRGAFMLDKEYLQRMQLPKQASLWVLDDILTTGSTLNHAARALKPLKMPVGVLSLARTIKQG